MMTIKTHSPLKFTTFLFAVCTLVFFAGCSDGKLKTEQVTGIITLDGKPYEGASISFHPKSEGAGAKASYGSSDASGTYVIQTSQGRPGAGTTEGEYIVTVHRTDSVPMDFNGNPITLKSPDETAPDYKSVDRLPLKYKDPQTTPFTATVVKGKNKFDFNLESE